jgi:macrolide-specific efflux system membrane fusion protein
VSIVQGTAKDTLVIPASALGAKSSEGTFAVRVLADDGQVQTRQVRVGMNNHVKAQVLSGLREGERVVVGDAAPGGSAGKSAEGS